MLTHTNGNALSQGQEFADQREIKNLADDIIALRERGGLNLQDMVALCRKLLKKHWLSHLFRVRYYREPLG